MTRLHVRQLAQAIDHTRQPRIRSGSAYVDMPSPRQPDELRRPVRVALLMPVLCMGGTERWLMSLIKHAPTSMVEFTGVSCGRILPTHPRTAAELSRLTTIHDADRAGFDAAASRADVLVAWGVPDLHIYRRRFGRKPIVLVSHGANEWTRKMLADCCDQADHYVAVAKIAVGPFPEETRSRVEVIPNGVEFDRLAPTASREELRARLGIPAGSLAVGYVGRFCDDKDPAAAARAVSALPGATAVYCGVGWADGEFKPQVDRLTRGRVRWIDPPEHVGDVYGALDCFVLTSPSEGFGLAFAEAWAAGVPTVCSPTGIVPEAEARHGQLCVRVETGADGATLAAAVRQAVIDRDMVARARSVVWTDYSAARMARQWAEYLSQIIWRV